MRFRFLWYRCGMSKTSLTFQVNIEQVNGAVMATIYSTMDTAEQPKRSYETVSKQRALAWAEREVASMVYDYALATR